VVNSCKGEDQSLWCRILSVGFFKN